MYMDEIYKDMYMSPLNLNSTFIARLISMNYHK